MNNKVYGFGCNGATYNGIPTGTNSVGMVFAYGEDPEDLGKSKRIVVEFKSDGGIVLYQMLGEVGMVLLTLNPQEAEFVLHTFKHFNVEEEHRKFQEFIASYKKD